VNAYASWNRATEVAKWQPLAGARPDALDPGVTVDRAGFEAPLTAPERTQVVAALALDSWGRAISRSPAIRVP
jgi:hypothetical protein